MKSERPRVCLLVDTVGVDAGTERLVSETARRLDPSRIDVHVCCLEDSQRLRDLGQCCKTKVFPAARLNSINGIRQIREFHRYLKQARIDVVHAFMTKTTLLGVSSYSGSPVKAMVASRLSIDWYTPSITRLFRFYVNPRTTRIWANSEAVKRFVVAQEKVAADKIDVIYQGVDTTRYFPERGESRAAAALGIPAAAKVVGIVANYRPIKDLPLFLRAAKVVAAQVPDAAFLLVGKGELHAELVRLAGELGIAGSVFFSNGQGPVSEYLRRMSIASLTSQSEGFSNAILEYMATGLPVVATDVGGNGEAIVEGQTGFLAKERNPEALAAPIVRLLRDEQTRCAMGQRALDRCRRLFSVEAYISRFEQYYRKLAESS